MSGYFKSVIRNSLVPAFLYCQFRVVVAELISQIPDYSESHGFCVVFHKKSGVFKYVSNRTCRLKDNCYVLICCMFSHNF